MNSSTDCSETRTVNAAEPALIVFAWGNESRGDDGAGPLLARRIAALDNPRIRLIEDLQLHIEHVMDLRQDVPALFIDASVGIENGFIVERIAAKSDHSVTTHTISPTALLKLFELTLRERAPEAYLLHVAGQNFALGERISAATSGNAEQAWDFLKAMFALPSALWRPHLAAACAADVTPRP